MSEHCSFKAGDVSAYLDGELTEAEVRIVEAHLAECEDCRRSLEALRRTRALVLALPSQYPPPEFRENLREALRTVEAPKESRRARSRGGWNRGLALVAASILVVLLPVAALVSTMMVPAGDEFPLLASDPPPGEMGIMEGVPEISTEEIAEPGLVEEIPASETYIIRVDDVEIADSQARSVLLAGGGEILDLTRTYDAAGNLNKAVLVGELPRDSVAEIAEQVRGIGVVVERRREEALRTDPGTRTELILSLEKMGPVTPTPGDGGELVRREALQRPGAFGDRIRRSFAGSWTRFGAGVATALVWIAGHLPHLAFAIGALLLVLAALRRGARGTPPKN